MNAIAKFVKYCSKRSRERRAVIFRSSFSLDEDTRILDLGSESGSSIKAVLEGTRVQPSNVYIADLDAEAVAKGSEEYGFVPVVIRESESLPFEDGFFDVVYCSSVIEHVTVRKEKVWSLYSGRSFRAESFKRQREFAQEIRRLGKQYFVQTPHRHFPIESHTWLPFIAWLPRWLLILVLRTTNLFWVKKTCPDWNLLNEAQMHELFNDAEILYEKTLGMTKSIMAVGSRSSQAVRNSVLTQ